MAKLRGPLLSFQASQKLGSQLSYQHRPGLERVTAIPIPSQPRTLPQVYHRQNYTDYVMWWNLLSDAGKAPYETQATGRNFTAYNAWMRQQLLSLSDLAARYHMDDSGADPGRDSGPNAIHGTVFGAVPTPGLWGTALLFDGIDDRVELGSPSELSELPDFSIEAWVKPTKTGFQCVTSKMSPAAWEWELLIVGATNRPRFTIYTAAGFVYAVAYATIQLTDSAWHHIIGVLRDTVDIVIWVDNTEYDRNPNFAGVRGPDNGAPAHIGRRPSYNILPFEGEVEEVRFYNRALATPEVSSHYQRGAALI